MLREEVMSAEQPSPSRLGDVGQEEVRTGHTRVVVVLEDHVRELVQHELLSVKR